MKDVCDIIVNNRYSKNENITLYIELIIVIDMTKNMNNECYDKAGYVAIDVIGNDIDCTMDDKVLSD